MIIFHFIEWVSYYVYILGTSKDAALYIGVTNNLVRRVCEHKSKFTDGFAEKYHISNLVYFESTNDITSAIAREKQLKWWKRAWKIELIERMNPEWRDLYHELL